MPDNLLTSCPFSQVTVCAIVSPNCAGQSANVDAHEQEVDEEGHRLVVRNGRGRERTLVTRVGVMKVRAPRVHDGRVSTAFDNISPAASQGA